MKTWFSVIIAEKRERLYTALSHQIQLIQLVRFSTSDAVDTSLEIHRLTAAQNKIYLLLLYHWLTVGVIITTDLSFNVYRRRTTRNYLYSWYTPVVNL